MHRYGNGVPNRIFETKTWKGSIFYENDVPLVRL